MLENRPVKLLILERSEKGVQRFKEQEQDHHHWKMQEVPVSMHKYGLYLHTTRQLDERGIQHCLAYYDYTTNTYERVEEEKIFGITRSRNNITTVDFQPKAPVVAIEEVAAQPQEKAV